MRWQPRPVGSRRSPCPAARPPRSWVCPPGCGRLVVVANVMESSVNDPCHHRAHWYFSLGLGRRAPGRGTQSARRCSGWVNRRVAQDITWGSQDDARPWRRPTGMLRRAFPGHQEAEGANFTRGVGGERMRISGGKRARSAARLAGVKNSRRAVIELGTGCGRDLPGGDAQNFAPAVHRDEDGWRLRSKRASAASRDRFPAWTTACGARGRPPVSLWASGGGGGEGRPCSSDGILYQAEMLLRPLSVLALPRRSMPCQNRRITTGAVRGVAGFRRRRTWRERAT